MMLLSFSASADAPPAQRYVGGGADTASVCGLNTACFSLEGRSPSGTVLIHDVLGAPVGAHAVYKSGDNEISRRAFCGAEDLNGPTSATSLEIRIQEVPGCGAGTAGTVAYLAD